METEQVRTFSAVAAEGSFLEAAKRLYVTQFTVSARIQSLEDYLGARLFVRNRAGAALTPARSRTTRTTTTFTWTGGQLSTPNTARAIRVWSGLPRSRISGGWACINTGKRSRLLRSRAYGGAPSQSRSLAAASLLYGRKPAECRRLWMARPSLPYVAFGSLGVPATGPSRKRTDGSILTRTGQYTIPSATM